MACEPVHDGSVRIFTEPSDRPIVLALRALKLGDLLVAVPALHGLRRAHPDHEVVLAAPGWLAPVAALVGSVDALLPTPGLDDPLPLDAGIVDVAANLHGNGPESRALIDALGARVRIVHRSPSDPDGPEWLDGILERRRWARLVSAYGAIADEDDVAIALPSTASPAPGAAVLHVGAFYGSRQWPVDRFAAVARALRSDGLRIVLTGGAADRERAEAVASAAGLDEDAVLADRTRLDELAALVADASVVVSADTGAAHLASAYRTPSVVVFGPAPVEEWGPPEGPHIALTDPAARRGDAFAATPDPALLAVQADEVIAAARSVRR
ncbi:MULTISPECIES: glycosyltransferase family 9 protein [Microbacterium]|uniref:glycosyltransferase family 9 protein n=1 Tax=Microbacterium TaxID=33882 RepID=UPI0024AEA4AF|nr:glycosyltransferase family 9 protein [Microbacterium barkeri]MDI6942257.1 glycosyltransferase family 9 protein [Microbacterium barkeri]